MIISKNKLLTLLALTIAVLALYLYTRQKNYTDWKVYGGGDDNLKYSDLKQIDTSNVKQLQVAWVYHAEGSDASRFGIMECNPIVIGDVLYGVSPRLKLFAVDAATGREKWHFDPADSSENRTWPVNSVNMNRGVAYWTDGEDKRIIYTAGSIVFAINAITGKLIRSFGKNGGIDLRKELDRPEKEVSITPTSPVLIYKDLFVVSGAVSETTPGHIRAYNVKTGRPKWIFHTVPYPGEPGYDSWDDKEAYRRMGSANAWSGFSIDRKRGLLYAGIGSPTNDFYGGDRLGNGLFGNCLVALDVETGKLKWHFQDIHHDVWDRDVSSPPALVTINHEGKKVDAVVQTTKTGFVFVLDRVTGKPVFPVAEKKVPAGDVLPGERLSPTQPFPAIPEPFVRHDFTENDLNTFGTDTAVEALKKRFKGYRSEGIYTPPSLQGSIVLPGYDGGAEWGGPSVDPRTNIMYINANEMPYILTLVKDTAAKVRTMTNLQAGIQLYTKNCMSCHGPDRKGSGSYPSLIGADKKYDLLHFSNLLSTGRRMMPGFNQLSFADKKAIASYVLSIKAEQHKPFTGKPGEGSSSGRPSYTATGHTRFLTSDGYPAIKPPWGTISAINLNTGKYEWKVPFGEFEELKKKGIPATGRENYGGSAVTAGGLLFIAASADGKFRAINKRTGRTVWETTLPAPGTATPAVYQVKGKQYVVIACGGAKSGGVMSDTYVAFALPGH